MMFARSSGWKLISASHEETLQQFNTNVFGAINVTRAVLPQMRARKSGTILFMSSIAAWLGTGGGGPYSSSKFALEGMSLIRCLTLNNRDKVWRSAYKRNYHT